MRLFLIGIAGFLVFAATAPAQSVKAPAEIKGARGAWIIVAPKVDGGAPKWRFDSRLQEVDLAALFPAEMVAKLKGKVFTSSVDGRFKVEIWCAKGDMTSDIATTWVVVGNGQPGTVTPDPDKPAPPATPPPIPLPGFRVLIVEETNARAALPLTQRLIFTATAANSVRAYLDANCAAGSDAAKTPERRILDKDANLTNEDQHWGDAMKRKRTTLPWIIISNGVTGFEGPLPKTAAETLALLKQYKDAKADTVITPPSDIAARIAWWERNYPQYTTKP